MTRIFPLLLLLVVFTATMQAQQYGSEFAATVDAMTGNSSDYYKTGFGAQAGMFYDIETNIRLSLMIGYVHWGIDQDGVNRAFQRNGGKGTLEVEGSTGGIPILFSFRLITPGKGTKYYGLIDGGIYLYNTSLSGRHTDENGIVSPLSNEPGLRSEPGVNFGLGALFPMSETLSLDIAFRYHIIRDSEHYNYGYYGGEVGIATSQYFSLSIGVNLPYDIQ